MRDINRLVESRLNRILTTTSKLKIIALRLLGNDLAYIQVSVEDLVSIYPHSAAVQKDSQLVIQ